MPGRSLPSEHDQPRAEARPRQNTSYAASAAQRCANQRRHAASSRPHLPEAIRLELTARLRDKHSPDQIRGRLALLKGSTVSHTATYRYARKLGLRLALRHPRRRRGHGTPRPGRVTNRRCLPERPEIVALRSHIGDWEADTVWPARGNGVLVTLVERRSGFARVEWSPNGTAEAVTSSILERLGRIRRFVQTVTCDRSSEFAGDRVVEQQINAEVYFADPHRSWQRGCNENFNGLLRQLFPRQRDFSTITLLELQQVEDQLNSRPRKCLGYLTPCEAFFNHYHRALGKSSLATRMRASVHFAPSAMGRCQSFPCGID